jgi:hypothetical protein
MTPCPEILHLPKNLIPRAPACQNFAPSVAERRRVQASGFIARAENHKIAGFTRSG